VTTVDIDADVVERASACLSAAGYDRVKVVLADAEGGVPEGAPYDRIIVTYAAWDVAPAWIAELAQDGRLVVPLRLCGLIRSIAFDREGAGLVSRSYSLARFVPDQGEGAYQERKVMLRDGVALQTDNRNARIDAAALNAALDKPRQTVWSGTAFDMADELDLFLTLGLARPAQLYASREAVEQGVVTAAAILGVPVLVSDNSIAYRTKRPTDEPDEFESGVIAFGPEAETLANQYTDLLQRWARDHRRRGAALFRYTPKESAAAPAPAQDTVIKRHGVVTVSWH
jgi:protein-L-isoaspartate(D-aspartate) O-methyltransferase